MLCYLLLFFLCIHLQCGCTTPCLSVHQFINNLVTSNKEASLVDSTFEILLNTLAWAHHTQLGGVYHSQGVPSWLWILCPFTVEPHTLTSVREIQGPDHFPISSQQHFLVVPIQWGESCGPPWGWLHCRSDGIGKDCWDFVGSLN